MYVKFNANLLYSRQKIKENLTSSSNLMSSGKPKKIPDSHSGFPYRIDKIGLGQVHFFMTMEQKAIFDDPNNKLIVIEGRPGTGKTLLLKAKAMELTRDKHCKKIHATYLPLPNFALAIC